MEEHYITEEMLNELGIDLEGQDKIAFLAHINEKLEEEIGAEITESLDDEQLKELLELQDSGDEEAVEKWLEEHVPELPEIVQDNTAILLGELAKNADDLNAAE